MAKPRQKDTIKARELQIEPKRAFYEKQEPLRLKLKRAKIINLDENLKRIYRIEN